jgi:two-component system LytT family sensor kinase
LIEHAAPRSTRLFWLLHSAGWSGVFLLGYLSALAHGKSPDYWKAWLPVSATGFFVTLGLRAVLRRLDGLPRRRLIALAAPLVLVACAVIGLVNAFAFIDWCGEECRPSGTVGYVAYMASGVYVVTTWVALYIGLKARRALREQTEAALAATAIAHQAQLRMLRYQLNPHFLFNTLNAVTTLNLEGDTATANRVVERLSAFLRHSLDADPLQRVTVAEEVDALRLYLAIEEIRFGDRLRLDIDVAADCREALVPSLLLQPLVENAIKHAVSRSVNGATVIISARRADGHLWLTVADDGPGSAAREPSARGVGLTNTRDRLRVLYGARHGFEMRNRPEGGFEVRLGLPYEATRG